MALLLLFAFIRFYSISDLASESVALHLRLLGSSIYEYHASTGRWPDGAEDLVQTSLPLRSPSWKVMLDSGTNVIVWHNDLKPDPAANADVVLAYHNRGLLAYFGRQWVCWGDLRTEYVPSKQLRAHLAARR